uniref:Uncharacterized protein n=1 Tax=Vibrio tasmaniensis TaxID=212663 RepID=A0A0H4A080_9VIBR|nr:hypothetical protein [Vibrio tasmaniensis]
MNVRLNPQEQVRLMGTIERLTKAGMPQKAIAHQLVTFGSKRKIGGASVRSDPQARSVIMSGIRALSGQYGLFGAALR